MNSSNNDNMKYYIAGGLAAVLLLVLIVILSSSSSSESFGNLEGTRIYPNNQPTSNLTNVPDGGWCKYNDECKSEKCEGSSYGLSSYGFLWGKCKDLPQNLNNGQICVYDDQCKSKKCVSQDGDKNSPKFCRDDSEVTCDNRGMDCVGPKNLEKRQSCRYNEQCNSKLCFTTLWGSGFSI